MEELRGGKFIIRLFKIKILREKNINFKNVFEYVEFKIVNSIMIGWNVGFYFVFDGYICGKYSISLNMVIFW